MADFGQQVSNWAAKAKARMVFVARYASTETAFAANVSKPEGRMPVYSGFLQASQNVGYGSMPSGPSEGPTLTATGFNWHDPIGDPSVVPAKIASWDLSTTLYIGWTAQYANIQDNKNLFVSFGTRDWLKYVSQGVNRAKGAIA